MSQKRKPESPQILRQKLLASGWRERKGKGDHLNFNKPGHRFVITVDMGVREIPVGTLRSIYRKAGWTW